MISHIFRSSHPTEYINNYSSLSLQCDEVDLIEGDLAFFINSIKRLSKFYPDLLKSDLWLRLKFDFSEVTESEHGMDNYYHYAEENRLLRLYQKTQEAKSLELKIKFLEKKIIDLGYTYEFKNDEVILSKISAASRTDFSTPSKHTNIFKSEIALKIFERLHDEYKNSKTQLADYSFVYRKMRDKLIHESVKPEQFRAWLITAYDIELNSKLKQLNENDRRNTDYNNAVEIVKLEFEKGKPNSI